MRTVTTIKTIKTTCGKTITYMDTGEGVAKIHSTTGPAIIYPESEEKSPEYYLYGIRYTKTQWQELLAQHKATAINDGFRFEM
jgi:hypothetical protein